MFIGRYKGETKVFKGRKELLVKNSVVFILKSKLIHKRKYSKIVNQEGLVAWIRQSELQIKCDVKECLKLSSKDS